MKKSVFKKDLILLIFGSATSQIGTIMQGFALSLYVLSVTGSSTKFASVLAMSLIPQLLLGPFLGVIADWFDRKKLIVILDLCSAAVIGIFALLFKLNSGLNIFQIYTFVILLSLISSLFNPSISTVMPSIMHKDDLIDANATKSIVMRMASLVAPILAGFFMGIFGLFFVLIFNCISFVISAISEMFINIPKHKSNTTFSFNNYKKDFNEGIKYLFSKKTLLSVVLLATFINFILDPISSIIFPYIIKKVLNCTDYQYGIFEAILMGVMLLSPILAAVLYKKIELKKLMVISISFISLLVLILSIITSKYFLNLFETNIVPYIAMTVISSFISIIAGIAGILIGTLFQKEVDLDKMGRTSAVMGTLTMGAIPLGQMVYGILNDIIPYYITIGISSIIILIISIVFWRLSINSSDDDYEILRNIVKEA
jgi:MFS family permease